MQLVGIFIFIRAHIYIHDCLFVNCYNTLSLITIYYNIICFLSFVIDHQSLVKMEIGNRIWNSCCWLLHDCMQSFNF